jgi:peptidylprolyl isomerase
LRNGLDQTGQSIIFLDERKTLPYFGNRQHNTYIVMKGGHMAQAEKGNRVTINFTGTLDDGTVFDSTLEPSECDDEECCSEDCEDDDCGCGGHESGPMTFVLGDEVLFPQIDAAIIGMNPGETKTVKIAAADAFGEYDKEKVFTVPRSELPEDLIPEVGDELSLSNDDDEELEVIVLETTEDQITFDANHPLAGENVTFEIELVDIQPNP